ncbi:MAG: LysR family transcriptional regulator [Ferrovum sp.]|jgi:DNA-binding transcriptional LysR family regulator|uniref:LysR family transcriptional regulator n=1 Tax=Ferrovum sp. TaxID=2609467 RepID=UPI0026108ECA|nr:LysR family transcriptional regulator [Ferrovum sp.]MBW8067714.1 LysR family transcriptional regulator [Ferrovum sp.]
MRGNEFAELKAFMMIVEQGSFTRAAATLEMAPSTLSQVIRVLEARLGVRLLHRTTRRLSVTEAGERLLDRIRPAFEALSAAVESLNDFRDTPMGTLRLSVSTVPAQLILAPLLREFLIRYPAIQLDITVDNTTSELVVGRFDAGIRYGRRIAHDMLQVRASRPSRIMAVAAPDYLARHPAPTSPQELQHHACIRYRLANQQVMLWEFEKSAQKIEIAVEGPLIVNDVDLMVKAAKDGIGIGYVLEAYVEEEIRTGLLVPILTDWSPPSHSYYLYYAGRHQLSAPLRAFIQFLKDHLHG